MQKEVKIGQNKRVITIYVGCVSKKVGNLRRLAYSASVLYNFKEIYHGLQDDDPRLLHDMGVINMDAGDTTVSGQLKIFADVLEKIEERNHIKTVFWGANNPSFAYDWSSGDVKAALAGKHSGIAAEEVIQWRRITTQLDRLGANLGFEPNPILIKVNISAAEQLL